MTPILRTENLSKYYINGQNVVAGLNRVSLSFHRGEFVAITGESGSGKSTLAHVLGGVLPYEDGELYIAGEPTAHYDSAQWEAYRRDQVAFISQNYGILPGTSVYDNVASALRLGGMEKGMVDSRTKDILEEVELWPLRHRRASRLSSGQKQRLAIARALAKPCPILLADEPTGNLDPENSEKVIRLLAQAAKERLVILITHEFSEAADFVTRHIRIHDGVIAGDEAIRPLQSQPSQMQPGQKRPKLGGYIAALQLKSRPVWCACVLLFFLATAFAVFAFLGSFIVATDDTFTRIYQSDAFLNGYDTRIVAVRKDGGIMTQADYDKILSLRYVEYLERYGYVADMRYAYREDVDYKFTYTLWNIGTMENPVYVTRSNVQILADDQFIRTVPYGAEDFLTAGRLPENACEVVAGDEELLGQTLTVYLQDQKNWAISDMIKLEMTVVGTTDHGEGLYFADELAATLTIAFFGGGTDSGSVVTLPWYGNISTPLEYVEHSSADGKATAVVNGEDPDTVVPLYIESNPTPETIQRPLGVNEILISFKEYKSIRYQFLEGRVDFEGLIPAYEDYRINGYKLLAEPIGSLFSPDDPDIWEETQYVIDGTPYVERQLKVDIVGVHDSNLSSLVYIHPDRFDAYLQRQLPVILGTYGDQVSMTIEDYSYTQPVINALEEAGYYALSPYVMGSTQVDEALAAQRMQTLYVCLGALIAVILLQMIVMRALFAMQNSDYRILSQIGLTWSGAKRSVWLQVLVFMVFGQILGFGLILLGSYYGVERLVNLTKYLLPPYWLLLAVVHLIVSVVAANGILNNLRKKVFPQAGKRRDLAPRRKEAAK